MSTQLGAGAPESANPGLGPSAPTLGRRVRRGLGWSVVNNVASRLGSLVAGILLARILAPHDYGVFAVAQVVLMAGLSMNELGVSLAVVRWPEPISRIAPTVATLALAWSGVLYLAFLAGAPAIAAAMNAPEAGPLIVVLATCVVFDAVAAVPAGMLTREFMQDRRTVIDLTAFAVGTTAAIVLALRGWGAWSMIWGFVATSLVVCVLAYLWTPSRFGFGFDAGVARELLRFGLPLAGSSLILFAMLNVDYVVVGRLLGTTALGFYLLAFNLCSWPVNLISMAIRRVSLAGFSRVADDPVRAAAAFATASGLVLAVTLPLATVMAVFALPGVRLLYGEQWVPAAAAVGWLCVLGGARVFLELVYDYLVAMGHTRANLLLQLLWFAVLAPALVVGAALGGIGGVAMAHALVVVTVVLPVAGWLLARAHVSLAAVALAARRPVAAALLVAASGVVVRQVLTSDWSQLVVGAAVGLAVAAAVLAPLRRQLPH